LDGQYGTGAVIADLADFPFIMRGKDYSVLERPEVQSRLHLPADQQFSRPESELVRTLYDCPDVAVGPDGQRCRVVVATHPANAHKSRVGLTRVFPGLRTLFQPCAARRVHCLRCGGPLRGLVAPLNRYWPMKTRSKIPTAGVLMRPAFQEAWQIVSQWVWNLRLELGHLLESTPLRTTEFAPPITEATREQAPVQGYDKPTVALPWKAGRFSGQDFALQPDGTLVCPASKTLRPTEQRHEADGSLRVLVPRQDPRLPWLSKAFAVSVAWASHHEAASDQRPAPSAPGWSRATAASRDWSRREHRRACMQLVRHQRIEVSLPPPAAASPRTADVILSRAQRAHARLSWKDAVRSQCASFNSWPSHDEAVRHPRTLCRLARFGDGVTSF